MSLEPLFTPGADRAIQLARRLARHSRSAVAEPTHLLWALVLDESRGAEILAAHGISSENLARQLPLDLAGIGNESAAKESPAESGDELRSVLLEARRQAAILGKFAEVGSEHLLCGLATTPSAVQALLANCGLLPDVAVERSREQAGDSAAPLATDVRLSLPDLSATDATDTL